MRTQGCTNVESPGSGLKVREILVRIELLEQIGHDVEHACVGGFWSAAGGACCQRPCYLLERSAISYHLATFTPFTVSHTADDSSPMNAGTRTGGSSIEASRGTGSPQHCLPGSTRPRSAIRTTRALGRETEVKMR